MEPETKRLKTSNSSNCEKDVALVKSFRSIQGLLATTTEQPVVGIPTSVFNGKIKIRNSLDQLRHIFKENEFRTSIVHSPREALSIYTDSALLSDVAEDDDDILANGRRYLVSMMGLHPHQMALERCYTQMIKKPYCFLLFCNRIRTACLEAMNDKVVSDLIAEGEKICRSLIGEGGGGVDEAVRISNGFLLEKQIQKITLACVKVDKRLRIEQMEHEVERIQCWNASLSNVLTQLFMNAHDCTIKDIYFKRSHISKFRRITIYLYDSELDYTKPPRFTFLPSLQTALQCGDDVTGGAKAIVHNMIQSFWSNLHRQGYFASKEIQQQMSPELEKYFLSGVAHDLSIPLYLNAHFTPNYSLSLYIYGKAGAGKSSFVRNFSTALHAAIEEHMDPELTVRFVKQNLNKPFDILQLEFDLRPNNNDLSVMSIIQGRRLCLTQSKPGLVVVGLEEMPEERPNADPKQLEVAQLISQRFSGRKGSYNENEGKKQTTTNGFVSKGPPRNSSKRGISGDASLITIFTSNYELDERSTHALQRIEMFKNIQCIEMKAISGTERHEFAHSYIQQCVQERLTTGSSLTSTNEDDPSIHCPINMDIPLEEGDIRPLVRHLRMLSFYVCGLVSSSSSQHGSNRLDATISQKDDRCTICVNTSGGSGNNNPNNSNDESASIHLKVGKMENLFPLVPRIFDSRAKEIVNELHNDSNHHQSYDETELSTIIDFWLAKALAPAVIVSTNQQTIQTLMTVIHSKTKHVHCIRNVDAGSYKMMKSLYDPHDTPNLRDDILILQKEGFHEDCTAPAATKGGGSNNSGGGNLSSSSSSSSLVAIELQCPTIDAQLCIREIIEDTPSMTAFSTNKSALYKTGLLFGVYIHGDITPEVMSRASLVI